MNVPRLLLVPSFTELEWGIVPALEEWAEVATFDMPGLGDEPLPPGVEDDPGEVPDLLSRWRAAGAQRGASEAHRRGWDSFLVVTGLTRIADGGGDRASEPRCRSGARRRACIPLARLRG